MKRIRIDFAPPSALVSLARIHPAAWLIAAASVALGIHTALTLVDVNRQQVDVGAELQRVRSQRARQTEHAHMPATSAIPEPKAKAVNAAIAQLNLPWRDVLDAVEAATPATIAILALEPDARKQLVKGMAEAKNSDEMIAYVEELKRQPFLTVVVLTKHEVNLQDPNKPIRFQFEAQWESRR